MHFSKIKLFVNFVLLVTVFCAVTVSYAHAQTLDEVLRSINRSNSKFKDTEDKPIKDSWIKPDTNMSKIFTREGKGILNVMEWLGDFVQSEFRLKTKQYRKFDEYLQLTATYTPKNKNNEFYMTFLIPHPKYIDLVNTGLVKAFASLEPPSLSTIALEKLVLKNNESFFYHHKDGGCSLLFKLPKSAVLNLFDKSCADAHGMIELAELMTIDRLKQKLES